MARSKYTVHLKIKKKVYKTGLKDKYLQTWTDDVASNAKCINYRMYKSDISLEVYITFLPIKLRTILVVLGAVSTNDFEKLAFIKISQDLKEYVLNVLSQKLVMNFIIYLTVHFFADQRRTYLPKYCYIHPSALKFKSKINDKTKVSNLANFIKIFLESVK